MDVFNVIWSSDQSGPSPYNNIRTEIFLSGCKRALEGRPCKGCFNKDLWEFNNRSESPKEVYENIVRYSPNKYVTFVGGEPLDQIDDLIEVTKLLKEDGYNILVFSWMRLEDILSNKYEDISRSKFLELMNSIDIFIDGEYKSEFHIFDIRKKNGLNNVIGSGNQKVWDIKNGYGIEAGMLSSMKMDEHNDLILYSHDKITKDDIIIIEKGVK